MKYKTDSLNETSKIRFRTLNHGDVFRLGSTLYIKTEEIEIEREYDEEVSFNAIDLKYGEYKYINGDDAVEYYNGEITFSEDNFQSNWK